MENQKENQGGREIIYRPDQYQEKKPNKKGKNKHNTYEKTYEIQ